MIALSTQTLAYTGLTGIVLYFIYYLKTSCIPRGLRFPPGPPGRYLIGNLLDFPRSKEWLTLKQWAKDYGDLVHINIFGTSMLFVSSHDLAKELFEKRGSIYSGRPHSTVLHELIEAGWTMQLMPYCELWKQTRAYFAQYFNQTAAQRYHEIQMKYTKVLLGRLYKSSGNFRSHIHYIVGATLLEITYGIQASSESDPFITLSENTTLELVRAGLPGTYLVDFFPPLKYIPTWFPGATFRRDLNRLRDQMKEMAERPIAFVEDALKSGTAVPCIATSLIEQFESNPDRPAIYKDFIKYVTGVAYVAGVDVTDAFISQFIFAMLLHPHVQQRAQQELDQIVGSNALPSFDDLERLKYVKAVIYEILRWNTTVPCALPHVADADDVINGYFIRKGTLVFGNSWALLRDETVYGTDADKFRPERFLQENTPRPEFGFGFGRRVCPGRYVGENTVSIAAACILHLFHILPSHDENGPQLPGEDDYNSGLVLSPKPFKCRIIPRSPDTVRILEELDL